MTVLQFAPLVQRYPNLVPLIWLSILTLYFPSIGSLSLKPPAEEILNKHLCPDPVMSHSAKIPALFSNKVMTVSLHRSLKSKDRTNSYFSRFTPCTFVEDPSTLLSSFQVHDKMNNSATTVKIRSINFFTKPWNFSGAGECPKFIMFRSSDYGNGYTVTCGMENFDQYLGPVGHPLILYYHLNLREGMISFPLFHPQLNNKDLKDIMELRYMLIYYSLEKNGKRTCRLQQYLLEAGCPSSYRSQTICGEYNCTELESLYQKKVGMVQDGDFHQQRFIIVKSKTQEKYRVRNFLRQKFVPIVFLLVLVFAYKSYMKAGFRMNLNEPLALPVSEMRLRRYHHRHHLRPYLSEGVITDHFEDIYFDYGDSDHIPGLRIPYEPSNGSGSSSGTPDSRNPGKYLAHGMADPPPSYDSLFPPTYTEATAAFPKNPKI